MSWLRVPDGPVIADGVSFHAHCWADNFLPHPNSEECERMGMNEADTYIGYSDAAAPYWFYSADADISLARPVSFAGVQPGGSSGAGGAFEYTPDQQAEIYGGMVSIFGLFLLALAVAWGVKSLIRIFTHNGHTGD